jgi:hypothetical protein
MNGRELISLLGSGVAASVAATTSFAALHESGCVQGFGCRPLTDGATHSGGRPTKPCKGRNRGKWDVVVQRALWGFERRR